MKEIILLTTAHCLVVLGIISVIYPKLYMKTDFLLKKIGIELLTVEVIVFLFSVASVFYCEAYQSLFCAIIVISQLYFSVVYYVEKKLSVIQINISYLIPMIMGEAIIINRYLKIDPVLLLLKYINNQS